MPTAIPRHVYIHVPFCSRRCSYCDFAIAVRRDVPSETFAEAVAAELQVRCGPPAGTPVDTLYFGGGTPSKLGPSGVARLLDRLTRWAVPVADAEVTLEANPEDVTPDAARAWRAAGINRVSLGVQSFDPAVLAWMHRTHEAPQVPHAMEALHGAGLTDVSLDLIFAVPDAVPRDWGRDLDAALALGPTHLSCYGLTVEPATPLGRWHARGDVADTPDDRYAQEFLATHAALEAAGFEHYEVSNFARPGRRARHNSAYWRGVPYLGLGPSAHGFDGQVRRWNRAAFSHWEQALLGDAPHDPVEGEDPLDAAARAAEAVYLGLRTRDGLAVQPADDPCLAPWRAAGWAVQEGERLRLTPEGWLRLDALAAALTAHRSP
ncbi:MAG: radical SAM family heme chaperone HemW [Gemmatimonadaceae bacterium]|nr:radical SAM family heme chaperone HemW [Gemmatimonadaceae bacterium]